MKSVSNFLADITVVLYPSQKKNNVVVASIIHFFPNISYHFSNVMHAYYKKEVKPITRKNVKTIINTCSLLNPFQLNYIIKQ